MDNLYAINQDFSSHWEKSSQSSVEHPWNARLGTEYYAEYLNIKISFVKTLHSGEKKFYSPIMESTSHKF